MAPRKFDILVVGGGMIGLSATLGFASRFKVGIIDKTLDDDRQGEYHPQSQKSANHPANNENNSALDRFDLRTTALNNLSLDFLQELGIQISRYCPFRKVEVWEEAVAPLKFDAAAIGKDQLGWIVENDRIALPLLAELQGQAELIPATVQNFDPEKNIVTTDSGEEAQADLIIAADGRDSFIRQSLPLELYTIRHEKVALVVHVTTDYPQSDTTWQRFTPEGAQAFLPLAGNNASLVWYMNADYAAYLMRLKDDKASFTRHLRQSFPERLGEVQALRWASFPTQSQHLNKYYHKNVILIGDAAHTVHPLAGQGANLGFNDLNVLLDLLRGKEDFTSDSYMDYQSARLPLNLMAVSFMEILYRGFSNAVPEFQLVRQAAIKAAGLPFINQLLIKEASGDSFFTKVF